MEDIGGLERRIKDLEYYVSLTVLELGIKDLRLPSSLSPNINRFKYGFFADSLDDLKYTDVNSVEYKAAIEDSRAVPSFETIKDEPELPECSLEHFSIVEQMKATRKKGPGDGGPPDDGGNDNVCVKEDAFIDYDGPERSGKVDVRYVTMASDLKDKKGKVVLYAFM